MGNTSIKQETTDILAKSISEVDDLVKSLESKDEPIEDILEKSEGPDAEDIVDETEKPVEDTGEAEEEPGMPEEGAEEEEEEEDEDTLDTDEPMEKSIRDTLEENEDNRKTLDVSEFLSNLVDAFDNRVASLEKSMKAHFESTNVLNKSLDMAPMEAKSFEEDDIIKKGLIGLLNLAKVGLTSNQEMREEVQENTELVKSMLNMVETAPVGRKSIPTSHVIEKSFAGETKRELEPLTKSQALDILTEEYDKGNMSVANDIIALEGTGSIDAISMDGRKLLNKYSK